MNGHTQAHRKLIKFLKWSQGWTRFCVVVVVRLFAGDCGAKEFCRLIDVAVAVCTYVYIHIYSDVLGGYLSGTHIHILRHVRIFDRTAYNSRGHVGLIALLLLWLSLLLPQSGHVLLVGYSANIRRATPLAPQNFNQQHKKERNVSYRLPYSRNARATNTSHMNSVYIM